MNQFKQTAQGNIYRTFLMLCLEITQAWKMQASELKQEITNATNKPD